MDIGAVLVDLGGAAHHGLDVFGRHGLHVTTVSTPPPGHGSTVFHRRQVESDARATTLRQTLVDCRRCLPIGQAVSVLDSTLRQGLEREARVLLVGAGVGPVEGQVEVPRVGFAVLRFTYDDLERRPQWVLSVVRDTLALGQPAHRSARER